MVARRRSGSWGGRALAMLGFGITILAGLLPAVSAGAESDPPAVASLGPGDHLDAMTIIIGGPDDNPHPTCAQELNAGSWEEGTKLSGNFTVKGSGLRGNGIHWNSSLDTTPENTPCSPFADLSSALTWSPMEGDLTPSRPSVRVNFTLDTAGLSPATYHGKVKVVATCLPPDSCSDTAYFYFRFTTTPDVTPPSIAVRVDPADPASGGWYDDATGPPTVLFACSDAGAGMASCTPVSVPPGIPSQAGVDGATIGPIPDGVYAGDTFCAKATDNAGNSRTRCYPGSIRVDVTFPGIDLTIAPPDPAPTGWYNAATGRPTLTFACSDTGSGIAYCSPGIGPLADGVFEAETLCGHAEDVAGNNASACNPDAIRVDLAPPEVTVPPDIVAEATGPGGAVVNYTANATDATSGVASFACDPPSGSTFPLGNTTVTCTAADVAGNGANKTFRVRVVDTTGPVVTCLDLGPLEGNVLGGYQSDSLAYACWAWDAVWGNVSASLTYDVPPDSLFPLGDTTVNATAADGSGNAGRGSFVVTVVDTTPPSVTCLDLGPFEGNVLGGYQSDSLAYKCWAMDVVWGNVSSSLTYDVPPDSLFPLGDTTVNATAADGSGNVGSDSFRVTVVDTTPPAVTCRDLGPFEGNTLGGYQSDSLAYACWALDVVWGNVSASLTYDVPPDSLFPVGATVVNATATDGSGNAGSDAFTVTVIDTTPPVVACGDIGPLEGNTLGGYQSDSLVYACTAADIVWGDVSSRLTYDVPPDSLFPLGTTTVNATATDGSGNSGSDSFTVTVVDTTPPAVTCLDLGPFEGNTLGGYRSDALAYACTAADVVWGNVSASLTYDVPPDGLFPVGETTVTAQATDGNGNVGEGTFTVTVVDTTPPTLTLPEDIVTDATGPYGAYVFFNATAEDIVDGPVPVTCAPASGSAFPIGTTTVACSATDAHGNEADGAFRVTIVNVPPIVSPIRLNITYDVTLRVNGRPGDVVCLFVNQSGTNVGRVCVAPTSNPPDENSTSFNVDPLQPFTGTLTFDTTNHRHGNVPVWIVFKNKPTKVTTFVVYPWDPSSWHQRYEIPGFDGLFPSVDKVITFSATVTEYAALRVNVSWDWGDGTRTNFTFLGPDVFNATTTHVYAREGTYAVTLTAQDSQGLASMARVTVVITGANPPKSPAPPSPVKDAVLGFAVLLGLLALLLLLRPPREGPFGDARDAPDAAREDDPDGKEPRGRAT